MRYRFGWFIPKQVLALTHFAPEVTQDEFMEISRQAQACLKEVDGRFHLIIDNWNINSEQVSTIDTFLQFAPQLKSLPLGWIVMVLGHRVKDKTITKDVQQVGEIRLQYVETLAAAFDTLRNVDSSLKWEHQVADFFANDMTQQG